MFSDFPDRQGGLGLPEIVFARQWLLQINQAKRCRQSRQDGENNKGMPEGRAFEQLIQEFHKRKCYQFYDRCGAFPAIESIKTISHIGILLFRQRQSSEASAPPRGSVCTTCVE
jgi:hypothetical protein